MSSSSGAWTPTPFYQERSRLWRFATAHGQHDLASLRRWSVEDLEGFWHAVERDLGIVWSRPYERVLDTSDGPAWARWWVGGRLNYVSTALRGAKVEADRIAIIAEGEEGTVRRVSYRELSAEVDRFATGLRALGVKQGDRVGIFMPLNVECAVALLAVNAIGAIFIPIFSGYGPEAIAGRLQDCGASLLICSDAFYRRGQIVEMKQTADAALARCPAIAHVIVAERTGRAWARRERDIRWEDVLRLGRALSPVTEVDAEDPLMIIYTSGTTGRPKGAVHVHGGFPVKAAQDLAHLFDLQAGDTMFWYSDIGWMMGPWLIVGGLMLGATIVLYDGTPDHPDASRVWSMVERHRVTHLGISPTAIRGLMRSGEAPVRGRDRSSLIVLGSTGEPWNAEPWWWYFREGGEGRCPIINYSGGTEISGGIIGCTTLEAIEPGSFSGPIPGMDADVVDERGHSIRGTVGELVIRRPWPGMTRGFWRDRERYIHTYWSRFPDVWVHGDWARIDDEGRWYVEGRSDDTLKISGKRVGPAEVESAAVAHPAVLEAAAVGIPDELKGEAIVVFAVLRPGNAESASLGIAVQDKIAEQLGRPLRPKSVLFVSQLPKTRNAKILRRVIRGAYLGKDDLGDLSSLENPVAIEEIRSLPRS